MPVSAGAGAQLSPLDLTARPTDWYNLGPW
jgi:hypothetical protein